MATTTEAPSRTLLFIGDSITDVSRREDPQHLGYGYVRLLAEHLAAHEPRSTVINRGISGNRVRDLVARFDEDCLDLNPDVVTIYIGVNDTWRAFDQDDPTSADAFEKDYRYLLDQLSGSRPSVPVILVIPFVADVDEFKAGFHGDLDEKVARIRQLAREFGHETVDAERLLRDAYAVGHTPASIAEDGVHPSIAGHRLLADAWLKSFAEVDRQR
jgi:lysophospholipase L1-like esterase